MTTIDFNRALQDAKGASFEALPVGDYDVEVAKTEAVISQNGKPMIKTTMRVVSGPYEKRPIINQFVFSGENPQAVAIFFRHMKAFGLTEEFFSALGAVSSLEPVANALVGRRARLTIGHREWQGETRNEVKSVKPYTGAPPAVAPTGPGAAMAPPLAGPAPLPPQFANGGPVPAPAAPVAPPAPTAAPAPLPPAAPPLPPQVQPVPQPPAPAQTAYEAATGQPEAPIAPPAPPTLPV